MPQTFYRLVVQIHVRNFDISITQGVRVDAKTMILGSDFHLFGATVQDGVVGAVMSEFKLIGFASYC